MIKGELRGLGEEERWNILEKTLYMRIAEKALSKKVDPRI